MQALRREIAQVTAFDTLTEEKAPLDPCRLTIRCTNTNVTGQELSAILHEDFAIDAEMADANYLVCICTGADTERDYARLMGALRDKRVLRRFQAASAAAAVSGAGARVLGAKGVVWRQNNRAVGAQRRKNLCAADYAVSARRAACISGRADSASSH